MLAAKKSLAAFFKGKDVLVTGGCGSIGREIVKQVLKYNPKRVKVFDNDEAGLFNLQQELRSSKIRPLLGDIRDKQRLGFAVRGTDIVFHAAALKHVPLCEYNPFEAVKTNVLGTQNAVEVARAARVKHFISISTDKAVNPINTMGATKLLSEKLVLTAAIGEGCVTKFSCVRFGNVLNSAGSVIPIFKDQIKRGGPLTITSPLMERFFMSIPQAVHLVLKAAMLSKGAETFILQMNKIKIIDLAEVMIEKLAPKYGYGKDDIKIRLIGVRPGEKLDEQLVTEEEEQFLTERGDFAILRVPRQLPHLNMQTISKPEPVRKKSNINHGKILTKEEIDALLNRYGFCD